MATRSHIGYIKDDNIAYIYSHFDGYPEHVGKLLQSHYTDSEKVKALIELGDISSLAENLSPEPHQDHSFTNPAQAVTVAYHRDRGEDWNHCKPKSTENISNFTNQEFNYLYNMSDEPIHNIPPKSWGFWVGSYRSAPYILKEEYDKHNGWK